MFASTTVPTVPNSTNYSQNVCVHIYHLTKHNKNDKLLYCFIKLSDMNIQNIFDKTGVKLRYICCLKYDMSLTCRVMIFYNEGLLLEKIVFDNEEHGHHDILFVKITILFSEASKQCICFNDLVFTIRDLVYPIDLMHSDNKIVKSNDVFVDGSFNNINNLFS